MDMGLAGKVALVTGASRGIGLAITQALVAEGAQVAAAAREKSDELGVLEAEGSAHQILADLSAPDAPGLVVEEAVAAFGGIDVLVNNVGAVRPRLNGFAALTDDDWDWAFSLNFLPAVRTTRAALPHLLARAPSTIVTVSSVNAFLPDPGVMDYSAAKAALSNFCKSLSKEVGPQGIRVNTVSPGPVETALWLGAGGVAQTIAARAGGAPTDVAKQAVAGAATGRFTHPNEVAELVVLLAGTRAGNVTGADFVIDGGLITTL